MDAASSADSRPRWWFVTRKYPPAVGGMERLSFEVTTRLAKLQPAKIVAMRPSAFGLPGFLVVSTLRVLAGCIRGRVSLLHLSDSVLAPLALVTRAFGVPTVVTIHGLDVVYRAPLYRLWRALFLRGFDAYVCNSRATRAAAIEARVPEDRIHVIGIGVDAPVANAQSVARDDDRLLFIGRLIERKGLAWFVRDVLPRIVTLRSSVRLAILGDGPERPKIISAAQGAGIADNLIWLGAANDDVKASELARAAICVMPNVAVDGDIEGFGIVALEAAAAGCPLVAADIDGLRDAVADGRSGTLVASRNADAWVYAIEQVLADAAASRQAGETARGYVSQHGSWDAIIEAYERLFLDIAGSVRQRAP